MSDAFSELTKDITSLGFDAVLYSFFPRPMYINAKIQPVLHFSEAFAPFVSNYLTNDYGNRDFILRLALEGRQGTVDWWEEINSGNVTKEEQEVTIDAKQNFGIHHGLSIPILSGSFAISGISVISKNPDLSHFQEIKEQSLDALKELASDYHTKIIMSQNDVRFFVLPLIEQLNDTKKKVIKHLMSGKPMKNISDTYGGLTPRYAEKVVIEIRKEFGDISKNELIYILGMIHVHQFL
ncbi:autoinducer binding domain-containing protein [Leucothrix arctica]|uniref:autoinducer binding domain-containing protein n=1 Tax=Leucothrix arctica TaxID=1481894 RepID=UPI001304CCE0|nr:autoinducer binding domain-containing protein [Leucothrix arctica]